MPSPSLRLYAESFAPWCEKVRWVLDHHRFAYDDREHVPLLGEPRLRWIGRHLPRPVTVPLLVMDGEPVCGSLDIARRLDDVGRARTLFPESALQACLDWNTASETLMQAGRARLLARLRTMPDALAEQVPLPSAFPVLGRWLGRLGVDFIAAKYDTEHLRSTAITTMVAVLDRLRAELGGRTTPLSGDLHFDDIAMASALQFLTPVADAYISLGPATRRAWTDNDLAPLYPDLLAWRDAMYATYRATSAQPLHYP